MVSGVYHIWNTQTDDRFIGSAKHNAIELVEHYASTLTKKGNFPMLVGSQAFECKLACDWRLYGEKSFVWGILEETKSVTWVIRDRWRFWCDKLRPTYNLKDYHPRVSAIYRVHNLKTGQAYIGQSTDVYSRWHVHRGNLNNGSHHNKELQKAWLDYQPSDFSFEILEECFPENIILTALEKSWIRRTSNLYNVIK